jgi:hypothetical protein
MNGSTEFRLRHAPLRELDDQELWVAAARGWVAPSLLRAECTRRAQWRRATDSRVRAAFAEVA